MMVFYEVDSNYINAKLLRDHKDNSMIVAYKKLWEQTTWNRTVKPSLHILDNEASTLFKTEIQKQCKLQLVPPDMHWRNLAEHAIQTFKSHLQS